MATGLVMLIEDDRDIREAVVEALQDEGYAVICAIDGVDALEQLRGPGPAPDLVLLDLMMPRMDGLQFRREMLNVPEWRHIPVVVITADAHARARGGPLEAAAVLRKPVRLADLCGTVRDVLRAKH
jgi:two-component system chemotaxis response regulator CheY